MLHLLLLTACMTADGTAEPDAFREWLTLYGQEAAAYRIEVAEAAGDFRSLTLQVEPVLQYTNPERGFQQHGAFYIWTLDGRPQCVGSIWSTIPHDDNQHRWLANELHSLSSGPLRSQHDPRSSPRGVVPDWQTDQPGVKWIDVDDAPAPAASPALRLVQMRRLVESMNAAILHPQTNAPTELRLMPQPLYRYPRDAAGAADGGLFALVQGTDPEVLVLVEAVGDRQDARWRFAVARFTHLAANASLGNRLIWECEKAEPDVGDQPYFLYRRIRPLGLDRP